MEHNCLAVSSGPSQIVQPTVSPVTYKHLYFRQRVAKLGLSVDGQLRTRGFVCFSYWGFCPNSFILRYSKHGFPWGL